MIDRQGAGAPRPFGAFPGRTAPRGARPAGREEPVPGLGGLFTLAPRRLDVEVAGFCGEIETQPVLVPKQ